MLEVSPAVIFYVSTGTARKTELVPGHLVKKGMATHSQYSSHGQKSLSGHSPWSCKEADKTQ